MHKRSLGRFLASNPFPRPLTEGLFYREKMRAIHRVSPPILPAIGQPRILEIGGGRSGIGALLYPEATVTTLDIDHAVLTQAPSRSQDSRVCADACCLPFADAQFDTVTLFDVLEHITDDVSAAREALRVTKPGGWVLVSTPNDDWRYPCHRSLARWCPHESHLMREWGHVRRGYDIARLRELFGATERRRATFVNTLTAWFHDLAFSNLGPRRRRFLFALLSPLALVGYALHHARTAGSETVYAWQREQD
jgi:ubiquinone/menaquinone biosynthesis C-methylase UbiE